MLWIRSQPKMKKNVNSAKKKKGRGKRTLTLTILTNFIFCMPFILTGLLFQTYNQPHAQNYYQSNLLNEKNHVKCESYLFGCTIQNDLVLVA